MSNFSDDMTDAFDAMSDVLGDQVTLVRYLDDGTTATIQTSSVYVEQAGFVDDFRRAVFQVLKDAAGGWSSVRKGDYLTIQEDPFALRWEVMEIRDDNSGILELKCDGTMERL